MTTTTHPDPIKRAKARIKRQRLAKVKPPQVNFNESVPGLSVRIPEEEIQRWERDAKKAKRPVHISEVMAK